jgi:5,10-methylenetetrahydromethanopterin reductase
VSLQSAALDFARPDLEIWLAGRGPKMLHLGGSIADGVMLDFIYQPHLASYVDRIRSGAADSGRHSRICYSTAVITDDDDLEFVRPHMTYRLVDAPQPVKDALGIDAAAVDRIRSAMAGGLAAAAEHVRDEWVLPFVISGSDSDCVEQISRLAERHEFEEFLLPVFEMDDALDYVDRVGTLLSRG